MARPLSGAWPPRRRGFFPLAFAFCPFRALVRPIRPFCQRAPRPFRGLPRRGRFPFHCVTAFRALVRSIRPFCQRAPRPFRGLPQRGRFPFRCAPAFRALVRPDATGSSPAAARVSFPGTPARPVPFPLRPAPFRALVRHSRIFSKRAGAQKSSPARGEPERPAKRGRAASQPPMPGV